MRCVPAMCCRWRRIEPVEPAVLDADLQPTFGRPAGAGRHWQIAVLYGPHGAPDFFTEDDIDTFFATTGKCITTPAAPACA